MGWWIFFVIVSIITLILLPVSKWKSLFITGLFGMAVIFFIDNALVDLGAFQFVFDGIRIKRIPLPYWISYFPSAMIFAYYRPVSKTGRMLYILIAAALFALVEFITIKIGLFQHLNWNLLNAFILNIGGFTIMLWFIEWLGAARRTGKTS